MTKIAIMNSTVVCMPRQRALDEPTKKMAEKMLELQVNKKLLQKDIMESTNSVVTLKDLHNIKSSQRKEDTGLNTIQILL